jgi:hypothetical protein
MFKRISMTLAENNKERIFPSSTTNCEITIFFVSIISYYTSWMKNSVPYRFEKMRGWYKFVEILLKRILANYNRIGTQQIKEISYQLRNRIGYHM